MSRLRDVRQWRIVQVMRFPPPDELIGSVEAGRLLGKSPRTIHRLVNSGDLTPTVVAPGGRKGSYLFKRSDVERIAKAQAERAAS